MPKTGNLTEEQADLADRVVDRGRVAGTVRQEDTVGLAGEHVGGERRRRNDLDGRDLAEVAEDRRLDAEVVRDHTARSRTRRCTPRSW